MIEPEAAGPVIQVVAALITDPDGRVLLVRKRDTTMFMNPGGKPEAGESAEQALCRELAEEIHLEVNASDLRSVGSFAAAAANEPGHEVQAEVFALEVDGPQHTIGAEIVDSRWVDPADPGAHLESGLDLAPLATEHLFAVALGQREP